MQDIRIDGALPGEENMARDCALIDEVGRTRQGVVRLYSWDPYAVSLGYNQQAHVVDAVKCAEHGVDVVRRPTGGRAVLHAEEITYAVATPLHNVSAAEWYGAIHQAIAAGLRRIGVDGAAFVKSQPRFAEVHRQPHGALCFSASARHELEHRGRKFVGSAQRVVGDILLQHGSILLGPYHARLPQMLAVDDAQRIAMEAHLRSRSISLGEILEREVTPMECGEALRAEFHKLELPNSF